MEKPLYSGHNFLTMRKNFKSNLPVYSKHPIFFVERKKKLLFDLIFKCFYLTHFSTFKFSELQHPGPLAFQSQRRKYDDLETAGIWRRIYSN